jgi:neurotrimin
LLSGGSRNNHEGEPKFSESIRNVSAVIGKDAVLDCFVESLGSKYKVGWMRADQTVLSVGKMVTQNSRYSISHDGNSRWSLRINNVRESDEGCYLCQINTQPLLKQSGCIQLQFPPDISDDESSSDTTIHEGKNVTLHCSATGNPIPRILWRRDDGLPIKLVGETHVDIFNGSSLKLMNVRRDQMSAYLCIAVNGVEPAISKRIFLRVQCEFFSIFLPFRLQ